MAEPRRRSGSLMRDIGTLALGEGGGRLLAFIASFLLARRLGPAAFGLVTIGMTALSWALWPSDLGLSQIGTRESALDRESRSLPLGGIFRLRLLLVSLSTIITLVVLLLAVADPDVRTIALLFLLGSIPTVLQSEWYYQGKRRYGAVTAMRWVFGGLYLIGIVLLVASPDDLQIVPLIYSVALVVGATVAWMMRDRDDPPTSMEPRRSFGEILRRSTPVGLGGLLIGSVQMLPPITLAIAVGEEAVGYFGAAFRVVLALMVIDRLFIALYFPRITAAYADGLGPFRRLVSRVGTPLFVGSFLLALMVTLFSSPIIDLLYGVDYTPSAPALAILCWFIVGSMATSTFAYPLITLGVERAYLRSGIVSTSVTAAAIIVLSVTDGIRGAAVALAAGEMITALLMAREYRKAVLNAAKSPRQ